MLLAPAAALTPAALTPAEGGRGALPARPPHPRPRDRLTWAAWRRPEPPARCGAEVSARRRRGEARARPPLCPAMLCPALAAAAPLLSRGWL